MLEHGESKVRLLKALMAGKQSGNPLPLNCAQFLVRLHRTYLCPDTSSRDQQLITLGVPVASARSAALARSSRLPGERRPPLLRRASTAAALSSKRSAALRALIDAR